MSEIIRNIITTIMFLALALYAMHMRKSANPAARKGLVLVGDGFMLAAVCSLTWLAPFSVLSHITLAIINAASIAGVAGGLIIALRGMTVWYTHTEVERRNRREKKDKARHAVSTERANSKVSAESFILSCQRWAESQTEVDSVGRLAQSFLEFLAETLGLGASALSIINDDASGAPLIVASSADVSESQSLTTKAPLKAHEPAELALTCNSEDISAEQSYLLEIGLHVLVSEMRRQSLQRQLYKTERDSQIVTRVRECFHTALREHNNEDQGLPQLEIPHAVYTTILNVSDLLISGISDAPQIDFIAVESSGRNTGMTVSLSQSQATDRPRIGLYPVSRRLCFEDNDVTECDNDNSSNHTNKTAIHTFQQPTLLRNLPVYDSRAGWRRIVAEGLRSLIFGSFATGSQSEMMVVVGSRTDLLNESTRQALGIVLSELQTLITFTSPDHVSSELRDRVVPDTTEKQGRLHSSPAIPSFSKAAIRETEDIFV